MNSLGLSGHEVRCVEDGWCVPLQWRRFFEDPPDKLFGAIWWETQHCISQSRIKKGNEQTASFPYLNTGCSDNGFVGHEAMFVYVAVACSFWSSLSVLQQSLAEFSGLAVQSLEMLSCLEGVAPSRSWGLLVSTYDATLPAEASQAWLGNHSRMTRHGRFHAVGEAVTCNDSFFGTFHNTVGGLAMSCGNVWSCFMFFPWLSCCKSIMLPGRMKPNACALWRYLLGGPSPIVYGGLIFWIFFPFWTFFLGFLFPCFFASLLLRFSAFPCFSASPASLLSAFPCFAYLLFLASLLTCFSASHSAYLPFCFSASPSFCCFSYCR